MSLLLLLVLAAAPGVADRAFELRMTGRAVEARKLLLEHLAAVPDDGAARLELARTEFYLQRFEEAIAAVEAAVARTPEDARAHYWAGLVTGYGGIAALHRPDTRDRAEPRFRRSIEALRRGLAIDPADDRARALLIAQLARLPAHRITRPLQTASRGAGIVTPDPSGGRVMRIALLVALGLVAAVAPAFAEEQSVESRIESVALFKNGVVVVRRTMEVPGNGTFRLDEVPLPIHGTFWVEATADVVTRTSFREVEEDTAPVDFQRDLAGRSVVVHFLDGSIPPASGVVVDPGPGAAAAWNTDYQLHSRPTWYWWNLAPGQPAPRPASPWLVLQTNQGRSWLRHNSIAWVEARGGVDKAKRRRPVLLFTVRDAKAEAVKIRVTYLTKGMAWAPSYLVDVSDPETLVLEQKAVIRNELEDLDEARIELISGFPSTPTVNVLSPLSPRTTWAQFFQRLNQRPGHGAGNPNAYLTQMASNFAAPASSGDLSAIPAGEGVDLHYQDIGRWSVAEGETMALRVARASQSYRRIVEWIVPDARDEWGRPRNDRRRRAAEDDDEGDPWDAIRFRNPFDFPMTTAPAMTVDGGRFNGQQLSHWVNSGEETTIRITKALSIRTLATEVEVERARERTYVRGQDYRQTKVSGQVVVNNHRAENATMVIRRRFSGELVSAEGEPAARLLEAGVYSLNPSRELTWTVELKPGEEKTLGYVYTVLVRE